MSGPAGEGGAGEPEGGVVASVVVDALVSSLGLFRWNHESFAISWYLYPKYKKTASSIRKSIIIGT
jgi:hypothetical protein